MIEYQSLCPSGIEDGMPSKLDGRVLVGQGFQQLAFPLFFGNFSSINFSKIKMSFGIR